jgi:hypothetical protein
MRWIVVMVLACAGGAPPPVPPSNHIAGVAAPVPRGCSDVVRDMLVRLMSTETPAGRLWYPPLPLLERALAASCLEDRWSPQLIACIDKGMTDHELNRCEPLFTPEQSKRMQARIEKLPRHHP